VAFAEEFADYPSLKLDAAGRPVVAYQYTAGFDLRVLRCGNPACTSDNSITTPDAAGQTGNFTSLALDFAAHPDGIPVVSYVDRTSNRVKVLRCGDPTCSSGNTIATPDTAAFVPSWTSLALDAAGRPVVAYGDQTNFDLRVLYCGDATCSSSNSITIPDTAAFVIGISLALDAAGRPVVTYLDSGIIGQKVLHCGDPTCGSGNSITGVDPTGTLDKGYPSLVLDAAGHPAISYFEGGGLNNLRVVRCGNPACTAGNTAGSPDSAGTVGRYTSLALDAAGNPVVSYEAQIGTTFHLRVLRCGDATCSTGNSITSPDGLSGSQTSLVLDTAGNPVVAYANQFGRLAVLHCSTPTCA
jgi:hypothetical protein